MAYVPFVPAHLPQLELPQPPQQPPTMEDIAEAGRFKKKLKAFHVSNKDDVSAVDVERAKLNKLQLQLHFVGGGAGGQSNQDILDRLVGMQQQMQQIQQQMQQMQQAQQLHMQQMLMRQRNAVATETDSQVFPVPNGQGEVPNMLPATRNGVATLRGTPLDDLLDFYGVQAIPGTRQGRLRLLQQELGIPPPLFKG